VRRPRTNSLMFVDSVGAVRPLVTPPEGSSFMHPRFSPDGKRFAVALTAGGATDLWVYDLASRARRQLTTTGRAHHPTWTPDGRSLVFFAVGPRDLLTQALDGGPADTVPGTGNAFTPMVTPDGRAVVFQRAARASGPWSVWWAPLTGGGAPQMVLGDPVDPYMPAVSPDGRWLAYASTTTGRDEIYARPFPGPGPDVPISANGGTEPAWSPDGGRIYYRANGAFMEAVVTTPALAVVSRRQLFKDPFDHSMPHRNYDVAPDRTGFVMIGQERPQAVIVLNWATQLRARLRRAR
jgi:Tol biopolymer transport system component